MNTKKILIKNAFKYGLDAFTENIGLLLGTGVTYLVTLLAVGLLLLIVGVVAGLLIYKFVPMTCDIPIAVIKEKVGSSLGMVCLGAVWFLLRITLFIISIVRQFLMLGWTKITLELHDTGSSKISHLFSMGRRLIKAYFASAVYWLLVGIGSIFLVAPGVYIAIRYYFYQFVIVDQNTSFTDAFKRSAELSDGVWWQLFGFALLVWLINGLGFVFFGLGWLFTYPIAMLAQTYVYRSLLLEHQEKEIYGQPMPPV